MKASIGKLNEVSVWCMVESALSRSIHQAIPPYQTFLRVIMVCQGSHSMVILKFEVIVYILVRTSSSLLSERSILSSDENP